MFIVGADGDAVVEYELETAYDVSTAVHAGVTQATSTKQAEQATFPVLSVMPSVQSARRLRTTAQGVKDMAFSQETRATVRVIQPGLVASVYAILGA